MIRCAMLLWHQFKVVFDRNYQSVAEGSFRLARNTTASYWLSNRYAEFASAVGTHRQECKGAIASHRRELVESCAERHVEP